MPDLDRPSTARDEPVGEPSRISGGRRLGGLRRASALEGTTLLLLVFVAVPLKHLAGLPLAVRVLGPIHGLAFSYYLWCVIETAAAGDWNAREIVRLVAAAFIPFGGFTNLGWLRRRAVHHRQAAA